MALAKLGGGATLLGGGLATEPVRVGRETAPFAPKPQAPLPEGKTQAEIDAEAQARLFQPVAVELLTDQGGGASTGPGGDTGAGPGDSSGPGASADADSASADY